MAEEVLLRGARGDHAGDQEDEEDTDGGGAEPGEGAGRQRRRRRSRRSRAQSRGSASPGCAAACRGGRRGCRRRRASRADGGRAVLRSRPVRLSGERGAARPRSRRLSDPAAATGVAGAGRDGCGAAQAHERPQIGLRKPFQRAESAPGSNSVRRRLWNAATSVVLRSGALWVTVAPSCEPQVEGRPGRRGSSHLTSPARLHPAIASHAFRLRRPPPLMR